MDDETILQKGGTDRDINEYAKNNGADYEADAEVLSDCCSAPIINSRCFDCKENC
jgi:hypothetical protein